MARKTRMVETRMLSEYLLQAYGSFVSIIDVPLGVVDSALMATVGYQGAISRSRPFRPRVDAIVILPRYLVLIEAKVWQPVLGMGKLRLYRSPVPFTPELKNYVVTPPLLPGHERSGLKLGVNDLTQREIILELVVGQTTTNWEIMARGDNIKLVVYNPPWLQEVVDGMNKYWTPEYQAARQEKLALREHFGLE